MLDDELLRKTAVKLAVENWRRAEKELIKSVCSLYSVEDEIPSVCGSSVLLRVGDVHFALTAFHVVCDARGGLFFRGPKVLEPLRYTMGPASEERHWDFMVLELHPETASRMERFQFLDVKDIDVNDQIMPGRYYAFLGYPTSQNRAKFSAKFLPDKPVAFTNPAAPPPSYTLIKKHPEAVILLPFTREVIEKEHLQPAPDMHGISGGGVWRIGDASDVAACHLHDMRLVGICIQEHPVEKLLEGLRLGLITEAMVKHYPQLSELLPRATRFIAKD